MINITYNNKPTAAGFEPTRAEPSGFQVHLLNHSDKPPDLWPITQTLISYTQGLLTATPMIPVARIIGNDIAINTAESDCLCYIIETKFVEENPVLIESLLYSSVCLIN